MGEKKMDEGEFKLLASLPPMVTVTAINNQTPVRLAPDGQIICFVDSGQELMLTGAIGEWQQIIFYVRKEDVK